MVLVRVIALVVVLHLLGAGRRDGADVDGGGRAGTMVIEIDQGTFNLLVGTGIAIGTVNIGMCLYEWVPVWMLGGVTKLDRALGVACSMCRYGMEAGDVVRTLSCGHVFHKACSSSIDKWLRENKLVCPICRETARSVRVLPWKARPPPPSPSPEEQKPPAPETSTSSSSSSSTHARLAAEETDVEAQLLPPPATSSAESPEEQHQLPSSASSSSADTRSLEEPLLRTPGSP